MARQAPTYAAHIEAVRAQASEDAAAERRRLQSQLIHLEGEVHKLRELWQAEKQAKEGLLEVERIQVSMSAPGARGPMMVLDRPCSVRPPRPALSALLTCWTWSSPG